MRALILLLYYGIINLPHARSRGRYFYFAPSCFLLTRYIMYLYKSLSITLASASRACGNDGIVIESDLYYDKREVVRHMQWLRKGITHLWQW